MAPFRPHRTLRLVRTAPCAGALAALCAFAAFPATAAPAQAQVEASAPSLEPLFDAAAADAESVAPLLLRGSLRLGELEGDAFHALAERLEPFCRRAFFSPEPVPGLEPLGVRRHVVRSGELPGRIVQRYRIGPGLLAWLNEGYDERRLRAGQPLKVLDLEGADLTLTVDLARCRLAAWRRLPAAAPDAGWLLLAYVPIGIGADETPTPTGRTRVTARVLDPQWTHPVTKQVFAPDDPGNLLGGYWMALDAEGLGEGGIGLHGYTGDAPEIWLEKKASNGCLRLRKQDMDRIFHLALEGTEVTITP